MDEFVALLLSVAAAVAAVLLMRAGLHAFALAGLHPELPAGALQLLAAAAAGVAAYRAASRSEPRLGS